MFMKTLKCDMCEHEAQGETFEDWMTALMPHYMEAHADIMNNKAGASKEEMDKGQAKWMFDNKARFDAA
jgi:hypothetical protein